jgi:UDP-glucose 4-epimerase
MTNTTHSQRRIADAAVPLSGRRALVTGGAGFIGSHLSSHLVAHGVNVRVFDNFSTGFERNISHLRDRVEVVRGDICDLEQISAAMHQVDVVFHQAAVASVPRSVADPLRSHMHCATGTVNVLRAAEQAAVRRVVFASSSSVYGDQPYMSKRETDPPAPLSPYAAAKLACEGYGRAFHASYGLETVMLRYFNVFGPRQDPHGDYAAVIPRFVTRMLSGQPLIVFGDGQQSRDFTYIENVVLANFLAATVPGVGGKWFNVANGKSTSLLELIRLIESALERTATVEHQPARTGDVRHSLADITLAQQLLGYEPLVEVEGGIQVTAQHFAEAMR